jgi:adenosylhomocysteinase
VAAEIERRFVVKPLTRDFASDASSLGDLLGEVANDSRPLCLVDVGGYFSDVLPSLAERYPNLVGVVEGTENGHLRYERLDTPPVPIFSVARSPLKYPENHLVGAGVVYSLESLLRADDRILQGMRATVIGYGRIGRGVAQALRARFVDVTIRDTDPIAVAEAAAQGFQVSRTLEQALSQSRVILCATGNTALSNSDFELLMPDAIIATVTSADDELGPIPTKYAKTMQSEHLTLYRHPSHRFFLANEGNAVNFLHGAVLGPSIHMIEGEKLACIDAVIRGDGQPGVRELASATRRTIAEVWLEHFGPE